MTAHLIAGKQALREHADHGLECDETLAFLAKLLGETDEPLDLGRHPDQGFSVLMVCWPVQFEGDRKAEIWNKRERMRWINGKRRENRKNMCQEMLTQPFRFRLVEIRRIEEGNPNSLQLLAQFTPPPLLFRRQKADALAELGELFGRRKPVLGRRRYSGAQLPAQTGDPHHEEFVEIVGGNRQKSQLLEERVVMIRCFEQELAG